MSGELERLLGRERLEQLVDLLEETRARSLDGREVRLEVDFRAAAGRVVEVYGDIRERARLRRPPESPQERLEPADGT